ncbi:16S rRNA (cytosine(1402)-N(4))-methyltransferase RsmH [Candidatus Epulonipiscium viviparus]|uniref:16S rRNA (cytosine(1402)-N(4))-methyltransferase RsmH n=1 Tax=Candidatus Epulonipiscium viviparus TaxID=420336 RepID=UPI000495651A|nr:16S rRNA (cytosine(1402)-N(4))-methyltransferase RsmH [Candidatus Epulopiscium viviparus]
MEFNHISVLLNECIEGLNIKTNGIYVDGTLGGAGHATEICRHLNSEGTLVGIDQDAIAIATAEARLAEAANRVLVIKNNFANVDAVLEELEIDKIDGMLLDLGVSSYQLDEAERGFSYMRDAKLDMRMNQDAKFSAFDVVNSYTEDELAVVIKNFGEEKWARRIAKFIVEARASSSIDTTYELVEIIKKAIPKAARLEGGHPAKRTFQAIRIEVNKEIDIIAPAIKEIVAHLNVGGRLAIITFHSLEDRIVKHTFRELENPCTCPSNFPICVCNKKSQVKVITKKPILPSEQELENNSRSKSAKLRIVEKI